MDLVILVELQMEFNMTIGSNEYVHVVPGMRYYLWPLPFPDLLSMDDRNYVYSMKPYNVQKCSLRH